MTYNVWGNNLWPAREEALTLLLQTTRPDIILLQEVTSDILISIQKSLLEYSHIEDTTKLGWKTESNIFYKNSFLELVSYGLEDLNMEGYDNRGLFWARICIKENPDITLFVSTAHFPWVGNPIEIKTGMNQRITSAARVAKHLTKLVKPGEPALFGGDFNEDFHPLRILNEEAGMIDVFEMLDLPPPITHPNRPCGDRYEEQRPNRTLDWICASLPSNSRVIAAFCKSIRGGNFPPPSDHNPIITLIEIQ